MYLLLSDSNFLCRNSGSLFIRDFQLNHRVQTKENALRIDAYLPILVDMYLKRIIMVISPYVNIKSMLAAWKPQEEFLKRVVKY